MPVLASSNKSLSQVEVIMSSQDLSYNQTGKAEFKRAATAALRQIAKDLNLVQSKVSFNAGGPAVSGDANLMGMWDDASGIYITISQGFTGRDIMYRTISHMTDFTGGYNQWYSIDAASNDYESFIEQLMLLRK